MNWQSQAAPCQLKHLHTDGQNVLLHASYLCAKRAQLLVKKPLLANMATTQSAQAAATTAAPKEEQAASAHHGQKMTQISVRSLRAATYARLGEVSMKHRNGVNVVAKVLRVLSLLEHTGMDGALYRDVDVYIGDETAVMRVQASGVHVDALMSVGKPIVIRNALVEAVSHDSTGQTGPICLKLKQFSKVALVRACDQTTRLPPAHEFPHI